VALGDRHRAGIDEAEVQGSAISHAGSFLLTAETRGACVNRTFIARSLSRAPGLQAEVFLGIDPEIVWTLPGADVVEWGLVVLRVCAQLERTHDRRREGLAGDRT
jgi:hypothetical protein